jgi:hypothetical protein
LGDVFGEEVKTLALELSIPALQQVGEQQIAMLRFDYDELTESGAEHRVLEMPVVVNITPEGSQPVLANPDVSQSILLLKSAQARRDAVEQADEGNYHGASEVLRQAAAAIQKAGLENAELQDEREALLKQAEEMESGAESYTDFSRKMMSTQAIYTMTDRHGSTQAMRVRELERLLKEQKPPSVQKNKSGITPTSVTWNDKSFPLEGDLIRVGRAPQNEIIIKVNGVSRFHCQIKRENEKLIIEDLSSTNGTLVDGQLLQQPYTLNAGDEIYICNEKLIFHAD